MSNELERIFAEAGMEPHHREIVRQGATHGLFSSALRMALIGLIENRIKAHMTPSDWQAFSGQLRYYRHNDKITDGPYSRLISSIDHHVSDTINRLDSSFLGGGLNQITIFIDRSANNIVSSIVRR